MIKRNTARSTRLVCYTDDTTGLDREVTALKMPELTLPEKIADQPWRKLALWKRDLEAVSGDVLFIDLDSVITGSIDAFFDFSPQSTFCVIENWTQRGIRAGNTSVYRFRVGMHSYLYEMIDADAESVLRYRSEQAFISAVIKEKIFWPEGWCASFKHDLLPRWPMNFFRVPARPAGARVVCFTGKPDPDEARDGRWPASLYKKTYKYVRPTPWIAEYWR
jgi:hypothetical protein